MTITYAPSHTTFVAEVSGVDFSNMTPEVVSDLKAGLAKYGVLVFRNTGLDDKSHVDFSRMFGDLDDIKPYSQLGRINRLAFDELFDVSNIDARGDVIMPGSVDWVMRNGNTIFHVDSSFNPRRAGYSLLLVHSLPPKGTGGGLEFADSRQAYDDLDQATKDKIEPWVLMHSQHHSRKIASPHAEILKDPKYKPESHPFGRHKVVQRHEASGRMNLYIANHAYCIDGWEVKQSQKEIQELLDHASQPKYTCEVEWENPTDLVIWDNTCTLHRATLGEFDGKYKRDMRRTTVHDDSSLAWGHNNVGILGGLVCRKTDHLVSCLPCLVVPIRAHI
ncbi:hypothetical protein EHS25_007987 [Saitozyma podzolica]|uniref:TauD/TfdA-like domain-containing protein n=1 Tax=Saitozyma podzolica TaxID=1890683 RepID=A0A427YN89_9TREE|nr:hypothetical protein EHS25_007987 [Saitozyma podzolica]